MILIYLSIGGYVVYMIATSNYYMDEDGQRIHIVAVGILWVVSKVGKLWAIVITSIITLLLVANEIKKILKPEDE